MELKYRERQILQLLLNKKSILGHELSHIFNISSRTIRTDIKNINAFLRNYSIVVSSNNYIGYFLNITVKERKLLNDILESENIISTGEPEYREKYILLKLISKNCINVYDLSEELFISTSTILGDLRRIEQKIASLDKEFRFDKKNDIYLIGENDEKYIRLYLSLLLLDKFNEVDVSIISKISEKEVSFENIKKETFEILNKYYVILSDRDLRFFCTYILVSTIRNRYDYKIFEKTVINFPQEISPIVKEIVEVVDKNNLIGFTNEEIRALNELFNSFNTIQKEPNLNLNLFDVITELSKKIDGIYGTSFASDTQFINGLTMHIQSYMNKKNLNISFSENIIKETKEIYPFSFNLSLYLIDLVKKETIYKDLEIGKNEVAFISMHFQASIERYLMKRKINVLVVCSYGIGKTKLLETQIVKEFENLNILATISSFAYDLIDFKNVDLIITTTPLNIKNDIPQVEVEVPLTSHSIDSIKSILSSKYYWLKEVYPFIIELPENLKSEADCLSYMSDIINYIETKNINIRDKLIEREILLSTNIGKNIAMPHALFEGHFDYNIYIFKHKNGVNWGSLKVNLIVCILITDDIKEYMNEYMKMINHIYDNVNVNEIESLSVSKLIESTS